MTSDRGNAFINFIAYIAIICVGVVLVINLFFKGNANVTSILSRIAQIISYVVLLATSYFFAASKRNLWIFLVWFAAIAMIVLGMVL